MERSGDEEIQIISNKGDVVLEIKERIQTISFSNSIFTIPENIRNGYDAAFIPNKVSIGPYHNGRPNLQPMENHKWLYLTSLLRRKPNLDETLHTCFSNLEEIEPDIRRCYDKKIEISPKEFVELLLLDTCFIIELFLRYTIKGLRSRDDNLFIYRHDRFYTLRNDLIMLENQIPFFIIQRIFNIVRVPTRYNNWSLIDLTLRFLKNIVPRDVNKLQEKCSFEDCRHLLDIIRHCFLPTVSRLQATGKGGHRHHGATTLLECGIKFEGVGPTRADSVMDIDFDRGKLKIPCFKIHNHLETLFRNLIAYEHCRGGDNNAKHVTSYVYFMTSLMHSARDVRLLRREYILLDCIGKEEEVHVLFNDLCKDQAEIGDGGFYYDGLCEKVTTYTRKRWDIGFMCCRLMSKLHCRSLFRSKWITLIVLFVVLVVMAGLVSALSWSLRHHDHL